MAQLQMLDSESQTFLLAERVHDLRNLFASLASARRLLDSTSDPAVTLRILDALGEVASRGVLLTSQMLESEEDEPVSTCAPGARLEHLAPLLNSILPPEQTLRLDFGPDGGDVRCQPLRFDRIMIELVTNAAKALEAHGSVAIRLRRKGRSLFVTVADDGVGMSPGQLHHLRHATLVASAGHGNGFGQLRRFVARAGGRLKLFSREGRGTAVALQLPLAPAGMRALRASIPLHREPLSLAPATC